MKTAVIRQRVADFLRRHPPFDSLDEADLLELAGSGKVKFCESEEYLYWQGDPKGPFVWTIQQGRVELLEKAAGTERLRDVLGEGDLLGLERFEVDGRCRYSARTASDVILYGVAAPAMEAMVARYPAVRRFLAAHFSVSGALGYSRVSWLEAPAPPAEFLKARLAASRTGTVTPVDANGRVSGISGAVTTRRAVREMLRRRTDSLELVDGDCTLEGVLTARDVAMFCGQDATGVVEGIRNAASEAELKPLMGLAERMVREGVAQPQDIDDCCVIAEEVLAAVVEACLRLAEAEVRADGIAPAQAPYCWMMFGDAARCDTPGWELPSLAAIYDDGDAAFAASDSMYFAALVGAAARQLDAAGLTGSAVEWPEGAQPSMPLTEWKRLYSETIRNPLAYDLYARRAFFDLRLLSGEAAILRQLTAHIESELGQCAGTIALLAIDTMANVPPLTFFEGLAMGIDGARHESFDIGDAVVSPIANAARVFALSKRNLGAVNTLARLEEAMAEFPEAADVLRQAADAFRVGVYYRTLAGGPKIDCAMLGKFDQKLLKTAFTSIERFLEFTVNTMVPVE
ncbi:MAG: putative nucleotidyltransferase substrate binding domain-containing protein [Candidatus Solibacter sp.]